MKVLWLIILTALIVSAHSLFQQSDCRRPCTGISRVCSYYFEVDKYWTQAPDCLNCMNGVEADCDRVLCMPGDGRRRMWRGVNAVFPGTPIEVCKGDTVRVTVKNQLTPETTSIHWHGMHQKRTQHMDGVPMITQRPIQPDEEYIYEFTASEAGTHFYHSHSGSQRADGVYGHFIVRDHLERVPVAYDYDLSEHVISFLEFFNMTAEEIQFSYMRTKDFYGDYPKSIVINGRGHTPTNRVPPRKFVVQQGFRYRFRLIHAGNIVCPIEISIDNHDLVVFNSDGNHFEGTPVQSLTIANGERMDFVLFANQAVNEYVIRFEGGLICNTSGYAILQYANSRPRAIQYTRQRTFNRRFNCIDPREPGCITYTDLSYFGTVNPLLLQRPVVTHHIAFDQYNVAKNRFQGVRAEELFTPLLNNIAFKPPSEVLLCNPYSDVCQYRTEISECTHMINLPSFAVVELILTDIGRSMTLLHPMHLHGHSFAVVGYRKYNDSVDPVYAERMARDGYVYSQNPRPILKDTVGVPDGGSVIIRFVTDNPGFWLFHCHVDYHTEEGMQMVFSTGASNLNCYKMNNCDCMCYN